MGYLEWIPLYSTILLYTYFILFKLQSLEILHVHHSLPYMDIIILIAILAFLLYFLNMVNKMSKWNTCSLFLFWICGSLNAAFQWHMIPSKCYFFVDHWFSDIYGIIVHLTRFLLQIINTYNRPTLVEGKKKQENSQAPLSQDSLPFSCQWSPSNDPWSTWVKSLRLQRVQSED